MSTKARVWLAGTVLAAVGALFYLAGPGSAGGEGGARKAVDKIVKAIETGDDATAASEAKALAKKIEEIDDVMNLMKLRAKKGYGVGKKPGAIQPDGIELKLNAIGRDAPGQATVDKEAEALEKMAYRIAAIAEVAMHKAPKEKTKLWKDWAKDLRKAAPELAAAAKSKSPAEIQKAATKINRSCNNCHTEFK
jgi:hypothetical protein